MAAEAVGTVPTKPAGRAAVLDTLLPGAGHMKGACEVPVPGRWIYDLFLSFFIQNYYSPEMIEILIEFPSLMDPEYWMSQL